MRPNILFAFADDWGRYASIYKNIENASPLNNLISTPNIDRIAKEGALFTNALVPAPTCTPCRSSVLSGRYFWQTRLGAILQGAVWDENIPSYPRILENAGYHTGATYKVWGPGVCVDTTPYGDESHYYQKLGASFGGFSFVVNKKVNEGKSIDQSKEVLYDEVRNNFNSFMEDRKKDQPFCYWWGPTNTHREWQKGSGKRFWDIEPNDLKGLMPKNFPDVHDVREDVADYLGECQAFDRGLGVLIKELEESGELDNTLIVVSGDHGIPGFPMAKANLYGVGCEVSLMARLPEEIKAGLVINDMTNLMDLAPTFLEASGCEIEATMSGKSLWPRLTGKSGHKEDDWVITGRERHVGNARDKNLPYPHRAIRTQDYLYIYNFHPERWPMGDPKGMDDLNAPAIEWDKIENDTRTVYPDIDAGPTKAWMIHNRNQAEHTDNFQRGFGKRPHCELFDLKKDRDQLHNVANDSNYNEIKNRLHDLLMSELKKQKDPRVCEGNCRYESSPYTDVLSHSGKDAEEVKVERLSRAGD